MRTFSIGLSALALAALLVPPASASHPTQICLDLTEEHAYETSNDDMIRGVQAWPGATDAGHPAQHEGCVTELVEPGQDWTGTNIDFEIVGESDPDGDSPETPDRTCTVGEGGSGCWVIPPSAETGTQTIRGWIDFDQNDATVEGIDTTEGVDEGATPGSMPEPDATDVVLWHWNTIDPGACEPNMCGPTEISIRYGRRMGSFFGTIASERYDCERDRVVKLRKVVRHGPDPTVEVARTDEYGDWRMSGYRKVRGRYYAVTPRSVRHTADPNWDVDCFKDRSPGLRLR